MYWSRTFFFLLWTFIWSFCGLAKTVHFSLTLIWWLFFSQAWLQTNIHLKRFDHKWTAKTHSHLHLAFCMRLKWPWISYFIFSGGRLLCSFSTPVFCCICFQAEMSSKSEFHITVSKALITWSANKAYKWMGDAMTNETTKNNCRYCINFIH